MFGGVRNGLKKKSSHAQSNYYCWSAVAGPGSEKVALVQLNGDIFLFYNKSLGDLVVYLCAAGNADGPVRSRSRRVNQPALTSQIRVSEPDVTLFNCLRAHMGRSTPRSSPSSATYTLCGCGHGGTRNSSTSRNVQT